MAASDPIDLATRALDGIEGSGDASEATFEVPFLAQLAQAWATVAVASELRSIRESIDDVTEALADQSGFGVGIHLHNISDWLEEIAKK